MTNTVRADPNLVPPKHIQNLWLTAVNACRIDPDSAHPIKMLASSVFIYFDWQALKALERLELNLLDEGHFANTLSWKELRDIIVVTLEGIIDSPARPTRDEALRALAKLFANLPRDFPEELIVVAAQPQLVVEEEVQLGTMTFLSAANASSLMTNDNVWHVTQQPSDSVVTFRMRSHALVGCFPSIARRRANEVERLILFFGKSFRASPIVVFWDDEKGFSPDLVEVTLGALDAPLAQRAREVGLQMNALNTRVKLNKEKLGMLRDQGLYALEPFFYGMLPSIDAERKSVFRAIQWHVRAQLTDDAASAIPMFLMCLESLFPSRDATKSHRLGRILNSMQLDIPGVQDVETHVVDLYRIRNRIVHEGSHAEDNFWRREAWIVTEAAIIKKAQSIQTAAT